MSPAACAHARTPTRTHAHTRNRLRARTHTSKRTHAHMYTHAHTHEFTHALGRPHTHTRTHAHARTRTHARTQVLPAQSWCAGLRKLVLTDAHDRTVVGEVGALCVPSSPFLLPLLPSIAYPPCPHRVPLLPVVTYPSSLNHAHLPTRTIGCRASYGGCASALFAPARPHARGVFRAPDGRWWVPLSRQTDGGREMWRC